MTLKIKAWEDSKEKVISINELIAAGLQRRRRTYQMGDISNDTILLEYLPIAYTERLVLNGLELTDGVEYDYTMDGQLITFNNGVLTQTGHITINYQSL